MQTRLPCKSYKSYKDTAYFLLFLPFYYSLLVIDDETYELNYYSLQKHDKTSCVNGLCW